MGSSISACYLNQKCKKKEDSMIVFCKRTEFIATYYQQNFSMPDSVTFYVAKNPKTAELYLKMVKTCKYFFVKQPIIIVPYLDAYGGKWRNRRLPLNLTKYNCKYWITDEIDASASGLKNILCPIIPKLYQCDVKFLYLSDQIISYRDLPLIISSAERIYFIDIVVKRADSSDVPLEDVVAIAIKACKIWVDKPTITPKTMKELTKLPNFLKLDGFHLSDLTEVFDIDAFYSNVKKNSHTRFFLFFDKQISVGYMNQLETIIDEILETKEFNYKPPVIYFTGLDMQKYRVLQEFFPP